LRYQLHRPSVIVLTVLATAAVIAVNYVLQPMPLRDWLPQLVIAGGAVLVLLLLNVGWARGIRAAARSSGSPRDPGER
jgi:hypothetical protein